MSKYELHERWQFQPWYIKVYRWSRYIVPSYFVGVYRIVVWLCHGAAPVVFEGDDEFPELRFTRWETFKHIWTCTRSIASIDAGNYMTTKELIDSL